MTTKESSVKATFIEVRRLADEVELGKTRLAKMKRTLRKLVAMVLKDGPAALLKHLLRQVGTFYRTTEGHLLFFRDADHKLYDIEDKTFERYLTQMTDNVTGVRSQWLPRLQAWARFEAPEVATHFLAYNDGPDLNVIAINTFDGYMMRRRRSGQWERVTNGTDGILFLTPPEFLTQWQADLKSGGAGKDFDWLCSLGHFAEDGPLSVSDQRHLLRVWVLHLFVPALNPVHPIPLHEGVTGSGKSVMGESIGRWLTGPQFEVMDLPSGDAAKAEESIKLALCKRPLVVIDNVDSPTPWLEDFVCRVATGVRMSRRRLYTNAEEVHFIPRAGLIITSRDPHFRREDVARRLIPIRFKSILEDDRRSETDIRADIDRRRAGIWGDVLTDLAGLQDAWPALKGTLRPTHSLADFAVFGAALATASGDRDAPDEWRGLMSRLEQAQSRFTTEQDPLVELLRASLPASGVLPDQPVRDLYKRLQDEARMSDLPCPVKDVGALTRVLKNKRPALDRALGVRIILDNHHQGGEYHVAITRVPGPGAGGWQGGDSGDSGDGDPISPSEKQPEVR